MVNRYTHMQGVRRVRLKNFNTKLESSISLRYRAAVQLMCDLRPYSQMDHVTENISICPRSNGIVETFWLDDHSQNDVRYLVMTPVGLTHRRYNQPYVIWPLQLGPWGIGKKKASGTPRCDYTDSKYIPKWEQWGSTMPIATGRYISSEHKQSFFMHKSSDESWLPAAVEHAMEQRGGQNGTTNFQVYSFREKET